MIQDAIKSKTVPGPKGMPFFGNIFDLRDGEIFEALHKLHKQYGDIVRLDFPNKEVAFAICNPDMIQHVLQLNNKNYIKGERLKIAEPLIGNGIFISEGSFWQRQRRMMQPAFHRKQIELLADEMVNTTSEMLDRWQKSAENGEVLDIQLEMMELAMDIVTRTLFTNSLTREEVAEVGRQFTFLLEEITERGQEIIPLRAKLPTRRRKQFNEGIEALDKIIYRLIEDRRASESYGDDLLGMLLLARDEDTGEGMNDKQLRDELVTMFLAGHETTAITLAWSFGLMSQHPAVRRRLQAEVAEVLGDRLPTAADFRSLVYTQAVMNETLRLYPPLPVTLREAIEDDQICGYDIPAGSGVMVNFYTLHHHTDYWENPEGFDPERFLPENSAGRHRYAHVPFGGGPRQCIGNIFALMEGTMVMAMVTQRFELNLVPGTKLDIQAKGTLRPRNGMSMMLKIR